MRTNAKIALSIPGINRPDRSFSFRLQPGLHNEPCIHNTTSLLFVVSEIRGNFKALYQLLITYKIIDRHLNWAFGEGHLVVLGNCFAEVEQAVECLWFIYSLEEKARQGGGHIHFILGQDEIIHINGSWQYTHPHYALSPSKPDKSHAALYDANQELRRWLGTKNIIEKIGPLLFVHGSIINAITDLAYPLNHINQLARSFYNYLPEIPISGLPKPGDFYSSNPFRFENKYKGTVGRKQLHDMLMQFDASILITSYTGTEQITTFFDHKAINVATEHSKENSQGLLLRRGILYRTDRQGKKEKLIYPDGQSTFINKTDHQYPL